MKLTFSPMLMSATLAASVDGDVLTLNVEALDFGPLPNGATLPFGAVDSPWIVGDVTRAADGELTVPLILPHGASAPQETLFPEPMEVEQGPVDLPPYTRMEDAE